MISGNPPFEAVSDTRRSVTVGPQFFLAGQPKTGSTALYTMLRQHPNVYLPDFKEPNFFCTDLLEPLLQRQHHVHPRTLEEYLSLFIDAQPGQMVGEASTSYLRSDLAAANIAEFNPDARIVVMLREPAALLRSLHLEALRLHYETVKDLKTALNLEDDRRQGRALPPSSEWSEFTLSKALAYSEHVRYVHQLERFRQALPQSQLLILIYDDFRRDNAGTLRQVFRFLGVDDGLLIDSVEVYQSSWPRFQAVGQVVDWLSSSPGTVPRLGKRAIKALIPPHARRALFAGSRRVTAGPPPPPDQALMASLRKTYAAEVQRLSDYLGRDLVSLWHSRD